MREIKFRGKRVDKEQWIRGYLIVNEISDKYYIFQKGNSCGETDNIYEEGLLRLFTFEVKSETLGQYTGLKDKNGKEIYEGDIVKVNVLPEGIENYEVIYDRGCFCVNCSEDYHQLLNEVNHCSEVIANIYDNPDLIKE